MTFQNQRIFISSPLLPFIYLHGGHCVLKWGYADISWESRFNSANILAACSNTSSALSHKASGCSIFSSISYKEIIPLILYRCWGAIQYSYATFCSATSCIYGGLREGGGHFVFKWILRGHLKPPPI